MIQVKIPRAKFSYVYVFNPTKPDRFGKPGKYQVDILWQKTDQETEYLMQQAVAQVYAQAQADPKFAEVMVRGTFKWDVIKDGARQKFGKKDYDLYKDCNYIVAKSNESVQVIDGHSGMLLLSDREFFAGCTGMAGVGIKTYAPSKNVPESGYGISCALLALMKTGGTEADRLAGSVSVEANQFFGVQPQMPYQPQAGPPAWLPQYPQPPQPPQQFQPAQPHAYPQQPQAPQAPQFASQPAAPGFPGQPGMAQPPGQFQGMGPQPGYSAGQVGGIPQGMQPVQVPAAQSFSPPAVGANPFPQVAQPAQSPGYGAPQQFGPPAQQPAPHQTTPAWPAQPGQPVPPQIPGPQGYDPFGQPGTGPGQLPY